MIDTLRAALERALTSVPLPDGTRLGGHSYADWSRWYDAVAANLRAALQGDADAPVGGLPMDVPRCSMCSVAIAEHPLNDYCETGRE